jgi:putative transposase
MLMALSWAKPVRDFLPITEREIAIARVLRPLGTGPLQRSQAERAAQLLGLHWTTIYRLRARFLRDPRTSSLVADRGGRRAEPERLARLVEAVVTEVVSQWLPAQRFLAHPILDTHMEVRRRCDALGLKPPARNTVERRVQAHREAELMFLASRPRKLPRQVDRSELETFALNTLGLNTIGGTLPSDSCGRNSL